MSLDSNINKLLDSLTINIAKLRKKNNLSQSELAKILGVARPTVAGYETGNIPSLLIILKIAEYFNISLDYLFDRTSVNVELLDVLNFENLTYKGNKLSQRQKKIIELALIEKLEDQKEDNFNKKNISDEYLLEIIKNVIEKLNE